jgi:hypothetical protein
MKILRTLASALCIVIGALLIATWASSTAALNAIENGTVIEDATAKAITTDLAQNALVEHGTDAVITALADTGFNTDIVGVKALISRAVEAVVSSDTFVDVVHAQTKSVREQMVEQLNSGLDGPITVTLDFSDKVNEKLGQIPVIGGALPDIAVPGVPVQVMDDQAADSARNAWHWLNTAQDWFGWIGLAFVALGIVVSYRKRWFFAKLALAVAVISGIIWLVMTIAEPSRLAEFVPGAGVADAIVTEIVRGAQHTVATAMGYVALGAMIVALVLSALAWRGRKGEKT